jgi:glycosyltransferase involved in cell wall biosynthesis
MAIKLSIIIPTRNRARLVQTLLNILRELAGLDKLRRKSLSETTILRPKLLHSIAKNFPVPLTLLKIPRRGKSAAMDAASRVAHGNVLAFLDDDVVVQSKLALRCSAILPGKGLPSWPGRDPVRSAGAEILEIRADSPLQARSQISISALKSKIFTP